MERTDSRNIVILGFGRSGTTWIGDIVSKITGKLILFEPIHPSVMDNSERFSYSTITDEESSEELKNFYSDVLNKRWRKMWLLRNHVSDRLENVPTEFLDLLWKECSIAGFKEIRANFLIDWYIKNLNAKIVFIIRHPVATIASIKGRPNFWEFGWPGTYELFLEKTIYNDFYKNHVVNNYREVVKRAKTDVERAAVMWGITHIIALPELERLGLPLFYYEDFYSYPFPSARSLFKYLGYGRVDVHPAHLFTPSMTTLKTVHGIGILEEALARKGIAFFWQDKITAKEVDEIMEVVKSFDIILYDKEKLYPIKPAPVAPKG